MQYRVGLPTPSRGGQHRSCWRDAVAFTIAAAAACASAGAVGQGYPTKPVRMVTSAAGGGSDFVARFVASVLSGGLGQQVVVDSRGGSVVIPATLLARAPADGYTLLLNSNALWLLPFMRSAVPYDPVKDFAPVTLIVSSPNILVVHPALPVKTVGDLVALAKAKPGTLNFGTGNTGYSNHLSAELFKAMTGVDIVRVPYRGGVPAALTALMSNEVHLVFPTAGSGSPHVKAGRLRALAVTSAKPSRLTPGLPTMTEAGLPGYESTGMFGLFAPAKTPRAIVDRLNAELVKSLGRGDASDKLAAMGLEVVVNSPDEFLAVMRSEMTRMGKVITEAGIRDE